jgi:hypothetical protein
MGNITKERKARTMLKEFVDKILSLSCIQTIAVGEHTYARSEDRLTRIKPPQLKAPEPLHFCTLGGLVEYIDKEIDHIELQAPFIHAVSFDTIALCGWIIPENDNERFMYAIAELAQSGFSFDTWMDLETFNIALQSMFVMDETVERLLSVIGNLASETVRENHDDRLSQTVQVKTGITTKANVTIENPLTLRPYRTFREVEQPASNVIFRIRDNNGLKCALFESDSGKWQIDAVDNIKAWLTRKLPQIPTIG